MRTLFLWGSILFFLLFGQLLEGGHVGSVLQGTAAFIVLMPIVCYLFYSYGFKGFWNFWRRAVASKLEPSDSPIIDTAVSCGFLCSALGCVFGLIHVMENLSDTSKLGAGVAVAFVSVVYGIVPGIMLLPLKNRVTVTSESTSGLLKKTGAFSAASFIGLLFTFFVVLYATSFNH